VWVDDEDEFARHRVELGYPDEVIRSAMRACNLVEAAVRTRVAPYDGATHRPWLDRLAEQVDDKG
jgi:hypothetical protein